MTKAYVTKYALTAGIQTVETESDTNGSMITVKESSGFTSCFHRNEWHTTLEAALARAEEMRAKKIASLEKLLARMRALTFELTGTA